MKLNSTPTLTKYTVGLDRTTLGLMEALNAMFTKETSQSVSKSLLVRKALRDYTGKLLSTNDTNVIKGELESIRTMK